MQIGTRQFFSAFVRNLERTLYGEDDPSRPAEAQIELEGDFVLSFTDAWAALGTEAVYTDENDQDVPVRGPSIEELNEFDEGLLDVQPAFHRVLQREVGQAIEAKGDWNTVYPSLVGLSRDEREPIVRAMRDLLKVQMAIIVIRRLLENMIAKDDSLRADQQLDALLGRMDEGEELMSGVEEYCSLLDVHYQEAEGTTLARVTHFMEELVPTRRKEQGEL
jgi:hypothetical protein